MSPVSLTTPIYVVGAGAGREKPDYNRLRSEKEVKKWRQE